MLRLTLRSRQDGRFLARVVDPGGFPFVLDFGDERMIGDVGQRLLHGFSMWRHGRLLTAAPSDPDMLKWLAEHYAGEGVLVFFEEPTWPGRGHSLEDRLPGPELAEAQSPSVAPALEDPLGLDDETELMDADALAALDAPEPGHLPPGLEDASTEMIELDDIPSVDEHLQLEDGPPGPSSKGRRR